MIRTLLLLASVVVFSGCGDLFGPAKAAEVTISPQSYTFTVGETRILYATAVDEDGKTITDRVPSWRSTDPGVVIVDASGAATGVRVGNASVIAKLDGVEGQAAISIRGRTTGSWTATPGAFTVNLTITEDSNGGLTGSGALVGDASLAVSLTGNHSNPGVSFTLRASGFQDLNFSGRFTDQNTISGTLNGSGFFNFALTLVRRG